MSRLLFFRIAILFLSAGLLIAEGSAVSMKWASMEITEERSLESKIEITSPHRPLITRINHTLIQADEFSNPIADLSSPTRYTNSIPQVSKQVLHCTFLL